MSGTKSNPVPMTYSLGAACRFTGLSPELVRAWERRHAVVQPIRTAGGTRRYRVADIERLQLLASAVASGHRIGKVAQLDDDALRALGAGSTAQTSSDRTEEVLAAAEALDAAETQRLLSTQLSTLGPVRFANELAIPLLEEIGSRWTDGRFGIGPEHLTSGILRSLLGSSLQPSAASRQGPTILFATPSGERHELGILMAALVAMAAGANPVYLGIELPVDDVLTAVETSGATAVATSVVTLEGDSALRTLRAMRLGLDPRVSLWVGGLGARDLALPEGVEYLASLEALEQRVTLLGHRRE